MAAPVWNAEWTLRRLLLNTFAHADVANRFDYKDRDVLRGIRIEKRTVHDGTSPSKSWVVYRVVSSSYPQYSPYLSSRNRQMGTMQRRYRHSYEVVISLQRLSIDSPLKIRTGANRKWDFSPQARAKKMSNGVVRESLNVQRGLNGDHFLRLEWVRHEVGILFGRCYANGPPIHTNPQKIQFLTKHELRVIEQLINHNILGQG